MNHEYTELQDSIEKNSQLVYDSIASYSSHITIEYLKNFEILFKKIY